MSEARFKAGDKVRIKSSQLDTYWYADKIGEIVTIDGKGAASNRDNYVRYYTKEYDECWVVSECDIELVQEATKEEAWKDGLPQVGTKFEYSFDGKHWYKCVTAYVVGNRGVVAKCQLDSEVEQYFDKSHVMFRPIKSEKEKVVEEMLKVADPSGNHYFTAELICKRLYDAGWKKGD